MLSSLCPDEFKHFLHFLMNYKSWKQAWGWNRGKANSCKSQPSEGGSMFKDLEVEVCSFFMPKIKTLPRNLSHIKEGKHLQKIFMPSL